MRWILLLLPLLAFALPAPAQEDVSRLAPRPADLPPRVAVEAVPVPEEVADAITLVATPGAVGIARTLAENLPAERRDLARLLGRRDAAPVEIRVGVGREDFQGLQPGGNRVPSWAAGVAYPAPGVVVLDALASTRGGTAAQVLRHELAHVALGRLVQGELPRWFTEGFAQVHAGEWSMGRSTTLARASAAGSLIELDDLATRFPSSPADVDLAYAQSASAVSFLASQDGGAPLHRLFARLAGGEGFHPALAAAFGQPLAALEVDWRRSVRARYGWVSVLIDDSLWWTAAAMLVVVAAWRVRRRRRRRLADLQSAEDAEREMRAAMARRAWLAAQAGPAPGTPPLP